MIFDAIVYIIAIYSALQNDRPLFKKLGYDFFVYAVMCTRCVNKDFRDDGDRVAQHKHFSYLTVTPPSAPLPASLSDGHCGGPYWRIRHKREGSGSTNSRMRSWRAALESCRKRLSGDQISVVSKIFVYTSWYKQKNRILFFQKAVYRFETHWIGAAHATH